MGEKTSISWTNRTWNPWRGCTQVSPGCAHCYMFTAQKRYGRDPEVVVRTSPQIWRDPLKWDREAKAAGRRDLVFTCSWSDFFHKAADGWRDEAWRRIRETPNLEYQILTKRPERIVDHLPSDWNELGKGYPNVWLGVSAENQRFAEERIPVLLEIPARVHFVSCEPLLGPIRLAALQIREGDYLNALTGEYYAALGGDVECVDMAEDQLDWVIAGGESGPQFRSMNFTWAYALFDECRQFEVAFWGKQRSGPQNEMPLFLEGAERKAFPKSFEGRKAAAMEVSP